MPPAIRKWPPFTWPLITAFNIGHSPIFGFIMRGDFPTMALVKEGKYADTAFLESPVRREPR
jgi:hypothetical protein